MSKTYFRIMFIFHSIAIAFGVWVAALGFYLMEINYNNCWTCRGITPTLEENLSCFGVQIMPIAGMMFSALFSLKLYWFVKEDTSDESD